MAEMFVDEYTRMIGDIEKDETSPPRIRKLGRLYSGAALAVDCLSIVSPRLALFAARSPENFRA